MAKNAPTESLSGISSLDHVNILTNDLQSCRVFYVDILGFEEGFRPDFGFPGIWLYLNGEPRVHIIVTDEKQPKNSGTIDHVAFSAHNCDKFKSLLEAKNIKYEVRDVPGTLVRQLFCFDPNGAQIELNFEG